MAKQTELSKLAKEMEKEIRKAQRAAGRKIGKQLKNERVTGLRAASSSGRGVRPWRKKAIKSVVGKDGTLVFVDYNNFAWAQEFGEKVRAAAGKKLSVIAPWRKPQDDEKTFVRKNTIFAKTPSGRTRFVGSLVDQINIRRLPKPARMTEIAERNIDKYYDTITEELNKQ